MPKKAYFTTNPPAKLENGEKYEEIRPEEILMEWKAPEFIQYPKPQGWYLSLLIIAIGLIVYSIITANYLLAIITVILAIVINSTTRKEPKTLEIAITKKGLKVDERIYTFEEDLQSFWVLYNPPELKTLNFSRQQKFFPQISIQLEKQNPLKIREFLLDYLIEDIEREEHTADKVSRRLGF